MNGILHESRRLRINERAREYRKKYPERYDVIEKRRRLKDKDKINLRSKRYRENLKIIIFLHYTNGTFKCNCCDVVGLNFLTIDHIHIDGGYKDRKISHGISLYRWLIRNNMPTEFQALCWNCNHAKFYNGGTCPHKGDDKN
jgi:hypothetical protein